MMQNALMAMILLIGFAPASAQKAEFDLVGAGHCKDEFGGEGTGDDSPTKEIGAQELKNNICNARCGAVPWCLAYDDIGPQDDNPVGCVYYRVPISTSDGTAGGNCYKKKLPEEPTSGAVQASFGAIVFGAIVEFIM